MRLIGNKTKLLRDIEGFLRDRGVLTGTLIDVFSGTASVGRHFKMAGYRVIANDHLASCYAKAVAEVEVSQPPPFRRLRKELRAVFDAPAFREAHPQQGDLFRSDASRPLEDAIYYVQHCLCPREGIISRNFAPGGGKGRMYFTDENARSIDAVLHFLREGHRSGLLPKAELYLLLASLLDAADRAANISGTYGAYLKRWQRSALAPLRMRVPQVIPSELRNEAYRRDANELVREIRGDVLYIDPPYNHRQYAANYHVLQIIAEHHEIEDLPAFEDSLYGKTGLRPYEDLKSSYCVSPLEQPRGGDVYCALRDLVLSARVDHVLISYNEEGLLSREEIGSILARFEGRADFDYTRGMRTIIHRRFCSDSDRAAGDEKGKRSYQVLRGRQRGELAEWLFFAERKKRPVRAVASASPRQPAVKRRLARAEEIR
ncbi:MAG TPA: DNA adenine methylase [Planctomycetota bacterium]|nr:DNA adenine methylase [Planctomycetota bacterium]